MCVCVFTAFPVTQWWYKDKYRKVMLTVTMCVNMTTQQLQKEMLLFGKRSKFSP